MEASKGLLTLVNTSDFQIQQFGIEEADAEDRA
jgi:hypothetical protein